MTLNHPRNSLGGRGSFLIILPAMPVRENGDQLVGRGAVGAPAASSMDSADAKTDMSVINHEME